MVEKRTRNTATSRTFFFDQVTAFCVDGLKSPSNGSRPPRLRNRVVHLKYMFSLFMCHGKCLQAVWTVNEQEAGRRLRRDLFDFQLGRVTLTALTEEPVPKIGQHFFFCETKVFYVGERFIMVVSVSTLRALLATSVLELLSVSFKSLDTRSQRTL